MFKFEQSNLNLSAHKDYCFHNGFFNLDVTVLYSQYERTRCLLLFVKVKTLVKIDFFIMMKFANERNCYRNSVPMVVTTLRALTIIFGRNNRLSRQIVRAITG